MHSPRTQVWKSGEEMHWNNVKHADVSLGVAFGDREEKGDVADKIAEPWMGVEEVAGRLHLLHSPDDYAVEKMEARTGQECGACE